MPVTINGDGSITGLAVGGLGNGGIIDADVGVIETLAGHSIASPFADVLVIVLVPEKP